MRLFYPNLIDAAGVVFTPSTYDASYPADNLANEHRTFGWKTGATQAAETVVIDFGAAVAATAIIIQDHDLLSGDSLIKIEANASDSWGAPSFSQALTWAVDQISHNFASQSFRYWRFSFTKASAGVQRHIGRLFLGVYYTTTCGVYPDFKMRPVDLSQSQRTEGGARYVDAQSKYRTFEVPLTAMSTTEKDVLETFVDTVQTHAAFWFQVDEAASGDLGEKVYSNLSDLPEFSPSGFHSDGSIAWDLSFKIEEQL